MSRRASAWMPFHVADYLRDTMHLSAEEHGAYLLLIMACWTRGGHLPNDEIFLAKTARISLTFWRKKVGPVVLPFFKVEGAEIIHKRVVFEVEKAQRVSETRAEAGRKGGRPAKANGLQTETHAGASLPLPSPLPSEGLEESPSDPPLAPPDGDDVRNDAATFAMYGDPGPDPADRGTGPMLTAIPKAKVPKRPQRRCPVTWSPNPNHESIAFSELQMIGQQYDLQLAMFRDHQFKNAMTDWDAAFRNWLRRAATATPRGINSHAQSRTDERAAAAARRLGDIRAAMDAAVEQSGRGR